MKKYITLLSIFLFTSITLFGQRKQGYDIDSRWFWTINAGSSWTTADVTSKTDWGWGLTIGKSFNYNYGKLISFDIRGRYLHGFWYGQNTDSTGFARINNALSSGNTNYKDSLGFSVLNHQTRVNEGSVELVLHANKFRERTGWDLFVFGGVGFVGFKTKGDLLNEADQMYAYDQLSDYSQATLNGVLDQSYESALDGSTSGKVNVAIMPSLGFGIGYQFAPRFSMGFEHKTTFTRLDYFDGYNDPTGTYENDWYHYTSAYLRFHIKKRTPYEPPVEEVRAPEVIYVDPNTSGTTVSQPNYTIKALVKYVNGKDNINFRQNGNYVGSFSYNASTDKFVSNVVLHPGQNVFELIASNAYGTDQKTTIIIYQMPQEAPPVVHFINPNANPYSTTVAKFNLTASVLNIKSASQILMDVNGQTITNFMFNPQNGQLTTPLDLRIGSNVITISASNATGADSKSTTIIYNPVQDVQKPVVYFTNPSANPQRVTSSNYTITAQVLYVGGKESITFKQNGNTNQNFTYNGTGNVFQSSVVLQPGQNVFELVATNSAGIAQTSTIIIYEIVSPKPPIVTITNPAVSPYYTENNTFTLNAIILNVNDKNQVQLMLNNQQMTSFAFNGANGNLSADLNLAQGTNTITVRGTNNDGTDLKQVSIVYRKVERIQPPLVTYTAPVSSPTTVENSGFKVSATVLNVESKAGINVNFNGTDISNFNFNPDNKLFSINLELIEGVNLLVVTGTNTVGVDSESTTIIYKKPNAVLPPTVTFIDPISNPTQVFSQNYTVRAKVQHVASSQNIKLKINGVASNSFTYKISSQDMEFITGLTAGANIIEITALNTAGQDTKTTTIIYKLTEPLLKPVVEITQPGFNPYTTSSSTMQIEASVLNVEHAQNIQVFFNGIAFNGFLYNNSTKKVSFSTPLREGNNIVQITAINGAGQAQDNRSIIYKSEVKINPPVVSFISPRQSGLTVNNPNFTIRATVLNIENKTQVILNQNGLIVNPSLYTFNSATKELTYNTSLNLGNNLFTIQATNASGTHSASAQLIFKQEEKPCDKPTIKFLEPNASGLEIAQSKNTVKLKLENVVSTNQIEVLVNGVRQNPGLFNPNSSMYTLPVSYILGQNIVEAIVKNDCGETKQSVIVVYKEAGKPCRAPELQLIQPLHMETTVDASSVEIRIAVLNIKEQAQIIFRVNGQDRPFTYNTGSHLLISNIELVEGLNTVLVQASNDCGSGGFPIKITRRACVKPQVNISRSSAPNNSKTIMGTVQIEGSASDISKSDQLSITQNGALINFIFNEAQSTFKLTSPLKMGANIFEIKASNSCGEGLESIRVERIPDPNAVAPKITITNPSSSPFTTNQGAFNIQAVTEHITSENQISITVNGQQINPNFNVGNGSLTHNLTLVEGSNVIVATAINPYGSSTDTKIIIYKKPVVVQKPIIVLTKPTSCPALFEAGEHQISGYVSNITNLNQVSFQINGVNLSNVNPILINGKLTFQFDIHLDVTNNNNLKLQINAHNEGGSDSKSCDIKLKAENPNEGCKPVVTANFSRDSKKVTVSSTKDLSNVVLKFHDGVKQKLDGLSGMSKTFEGTGENINKCIVGVWIKSGCNQSNDGPGYGEWVANPQNTTDCSSEEEDCKPSVQATFGSDMKSVTVTSTKDLINVVLKYYDGQEQKFDNLSGKSRTLVGSGINKAKCIVGVWIRSGCNQSNDGPEYGEYVKNNLYKDQCNVVTEECGVKFNPGNATWSFCLHTPTGTYTRDDLMKNPNFTYSGTASSVYFSPIAGGGTVMVNGVSTPLRNGNYYLFKGNLKIEVKNPKGNGMGNWVICIESDTAPTFGTGNNRPKSPCEESKPGTQTRGGTGGTTDPNNQQRKPTPPPTTPPTGRGGGR